MAIKKQFHYLWKIEDKNVCFVFDEVHRCSNYFSHNGKLLYYSKKTDLPIIMLSATISDKPEKFSIFFYMLIIIPPAFKFFFFKTPVFCAGIF